MDDKYYKVWVELEEIDHETDKYKTLEQHELEGFETEEEARKCFEAVTGFSEGVVVDVAFHSLDAGYEMKKARFTKWCWGGEDYVRMKTDGCETLDIALRDFLNIAAVFAADGLERG